jgi:anti-sigma-K factor RskA
VVVLAAPEGANAFVASVSADGRSLVVRPLATLDVDASRALELWAVPGQGAPRSLGLIQLDRTTVLQREQVLNGTAALAVSLEPPGGSPTGAPTGPILYTGAVSL